MDICNCHTDLDALLCDIPREWRKGIVKAICLTLATEPIDCEGVRDCETLTTLSGFSLQGSTLSITYTNEKGTLKTSTVDIFNPIDATPFDAQSNCLMDQEDWDDLTHLEKLQAIIDGHCDCCPDITTTSTTTTTTECLEYYTASRHECIGETGLCGQVESGVLVAVPCGFINIPGTYYEDFSEDPALFLITGVALPDDGATLLDTTSGVPSCDATCPTTTTTTTTTTTSTTTTTTCCEITDADIELSTTTTTTSTTTTTTEATTTTTTTTTSTTTTTTEAPFTFQVQNSVAGSSITDVTPAFYLITGGAFPVNNGENLIGTHGDETGLGITVSLTGGIGATLTLLVNAVPVDTIVVSGGTEVFDPATFISTDIVRITLTP